MADSPPPRAPSHATWLACWGLVGSLLGVGVLGAFSIGVLALVVAAGCAALLSRRAASRAGWPGLIAGLAAPLLLVAFLNRQGPGTVCSRTATSESCIDQWSPWPWALAAAILLVVFVVVVRWRPRQRSL